MVASRQAVEPVKMPHSLKRCFMYYRNSLLLGFPDVTPGGLAKRSEDVVFLTVKADFVGENGFVNRRVFKKITASAYFDILPLPRFSDGDTFRHQTLEIIRIVAERFAEIGKRQRHAAWPAKAIPGFHNRQCGNDSFAVAYREAIETESIRLIQCLHPY